MEICEEVEEKSVIIMVTTVIMTRHSSNGATDWNWQTRKEVDRFSLQHFMCSVGGVCMGILNCKTNVA